MAVWSEVAWSALTDDKRLDAEHYRPEYLRQEGVIESLPHERLDAVADVTDGNHISIAEQFAESGIRYLRGQDLSDFFVSDSDPKFIPEATFRTLRRSHMKVGDVLLGVIATIGTVSLIADRFDKLTGNCKIAILRPHGIESEYLATYFASSIGQRELQRRARGTVQTGVILPDLKAMPIPLLDIATRSKVKKKVRDAYAQRKQAENAYAGAEALLESALGLEKLDLTPRLFYERPYADVQVASRFDAEYFQPPKTAVLDALAKMPGQPLCDQYQSIRQLWQPDTAGASDQVRNYDLTDALQPFLDDTVEPATRETIASTKKKLKPGDLVVSRLRHYLKEIAVVLAAGPIQMVGSTEFIVLRPQKGAVSVEALLVYLRSKYVQTVLKWCQDGSNHPRFHEGELLNLRIPDVVRDHQDQIVAKVQASIQARREARQLLDEAKAIVESAILKTNNAVPNTFTDNRDRWPKMSDVDSLG